VSTIIFQVSSSKQCICKISCVKLGRQVLFQFDAFFTSNGVLHSLTLNGREGDKEKKGGVVKQCHSMWIHPHYDRTSYADHALTLSGTGNRGVAEHIGWYTKRVKYRKYKTTLTYLQVCGFPNASPLHAILCFRQNRHARVCFCSVDLA
jgi:hypothetical protein